LHIIQHRLASLHRHNVMFEFVALLLLGFSTAAVGADGQRPAEATKPQPAAAPKRVETGTAAQRPADDFVHEIESLLKIARRQLPWEEFQSTHTKIAALVAEFARLYPQDPRVAKLLPERWTSLGYLQRRAEANAEIREVLQTTHDPALKKEALFIQTVFEIQEPIDDSTAIARAEAFAQQWPEDNRSAELLYEAVNRPGGTFWIPLALVISLLVLAAVCTIAGLKRPAGWSRRRLIVTLLLGLLALEIVAAVLYKFQRLPDPQHLETVARNGLRVVAENLRRLLWTPRAAIVVALAGTVALVFVVVRKRSAGGAMRWTSAVRLWIVGFSAAWAVCLALDAGLTTLRRARIMQRIVRDYPNSFRGQLVLGQNRQKERIGAPFELEFIDAISGTPISMQKLRGKVVVVDFWATWCGPCVGEMPEMKRLYAKYHPQGVEFIGVSEDLPEADGGLAALKSFVAKEHIPWPQFFQGRNSAAILAGLSTGDFFETWGVEGIPTVFLIDAEGKLYATNARGRLETLIPRLLATAKASTP
jgi:thiol-disulfide isomerase/thioredoxin